MSPHNYTSNCTNMIINVAHEVLYLAADADLTEV